MAFKMKGFSPYKQKDDDSQKMTKEQKAKHRANVLKYNKDTSKPLNSLQKNKIKCQDPLIPLLLKQEERKL